MQFLIDEEDLGRIAEKVFYRIKDFISSRSEKEANTFLTVEQLEKYLQVKKDWVYQQVHQRRIPYHKIGAKLRFNKKEIDQWIKNKK